MNLPIDWFSLSTLARAALHCRLLVYYIFLLRSFKRSGLELSQTRWLSCLEQRALTINGNKLIKEEKRGDIEERKIEYLLNNEPPDRRSECGVSAWKLALSQTNRLTLDLCATYTTDEEGSLTQEPPRVSFSSLFFVKAYNGTSEKFHTIRVNRCHDDDVDCCHVCSQSILPLCF